MALNKAKILWDSYLRKAGNVTTYSGAEVSGFEMENAYDWRDYSIFRAAVGTTNLDTVLAITTTISEAAVWIAQRPGDYSLLYDGQQVVYDGQPVVFAGSLLFQYESAPGVFTTLATFGFNPDQDTLAMVSFAPVVVPFGRKLRWVVQGGSATTDIRQLAAGVAMENPIGQHVGQTPPTLRSGVVVTNVITVNGSIIGRNYRRLDRSDSIDWSPVMGSWVRNTWEPFTKHASKNAFFYQWAPLLWPDEVVFAAAGDIDAPANANPTPRMKVSMPLRCLSARALT